VLEDSVVHHQREKSNVFEEVIEDVIRPSVGLGFISESSESIVPAVQQTHSVVDAQLQEEVKESK
jgi:hypothetical protein